MPMAETAELLVRLKLKDQMSGPAKAAGNSLTTLDRRVSATTTGISKLGSATKTAGSNFGRNMKSMAGNALKLVGVTAGIASVVSVFKSSVNAAEEMGAASQDLARVTGQTIESASVLVDVLGKYGMEGDKAISTMALLAKNTQTLAGTSKKAAKFQKDYGFSLTDSKGKILSTNALLKASAKFFTSNATAGQKATLMQKLYGRGWKTLIPLLSAGEEGIQKQFDTALKLTPQQIKNMAALRSSQREFNDTLGDTQVLIGVAVMPALIRITRALNSFVSKNQKQIVDLFSSMAEFAEDIGQAFKEYVIPAFSKLAGAWNSIPPELRQLLITGLVANKALKMTIGFDPLDLTRKAVTGLFSRGGSPATPMYTKEVGLPGVGGGAAAVGGGGKLGTALGLIGMVAAPLAVIAAQQEIQSRTNEQAKGLHEDSIRWLRGMPSASDLDRGLSAVDQGLRDIRSNPLHVLVQGDAIARLEALRQAIVAKQFDVIMQSPVYQSFRAGETRDSPIPGAPSQPRSTRGGSAIRTPGAKGEGARRGNREVNIVLNANTDHRQNSSSAKSQLRYGPTPATAGAK